MVRNNIPLDVNLDLGLSVLVHDLEGKVLHVALDVLVIELAADDALNVVDGPERVGGELVLCWWRVSSVASK